MQINDPATLAELRQCHENYETALLENDVSVLDGFFWDSPHSIRYGVRESLYGIDEVRAFRKARPNIDLAREITRLEILALSTTTGIVNLQFERSINGELRQGRQTQFWNRFPEGWKIVSAHVSIIPGSLSGTAAYVEAASSRLGLTIDAALLPGVTNDFQRISDVAGFLMEFPLGHSSEAGPVFRP
jgi:hypothetical protein